MEENLLDGDLTSRQLRVVEEADAFDLEDFYHDLGASNGAVCLITKNQMLMTDCYCKPYGRRYGKHYDTINDMYQAIYGIEAKPNHLNENGEYILWQMEVIKDGNIVIQLCSNVTTIIWIPRELNDNQREMFENFVKRMNIIIKNDPSYFEANPIEISYLIDAGECQTLINDFNEVLSKVNSKRR